MELLDAYFLWTTSSYLQGLVFVVKREPGMVGQACKPSHLGGGGKRIESSRPAWAKLARPYFKT
jgi:hypothetical protein